MNLFETEKMNISEIYTVEMYGFRGGKKNKRYSANLRSYELVFFFSGENIVHFSGADLKDLPDCIRYLPKGENKGEYRVEKISDESLCVDIFFDTDCEMPPNALCIYNMCELKPLFEKIHKVWSAKKTGYYTECMSVFYEIIKKIKLHTEKYSTNEQRQKIFPSYQYMTENFDKPDFDYKEMCVCSGLSYDYFKELFIKKYGVSPVKYVTALRIEKAKELLITGHYTVSEIAYECGFENVYYFSNVFKKIVGVSPTAYRKK